jgi:hypothetical protein
MAIIRGYMQRHEEEAGIEDGAGGFWSVKGILAETKTSHLVDWEDIVDGTNYNPTLRAQSQRRRRRGHVSTTRTRPDVQQEVKAYV